MAITAGRSSSTYQALTTSYETAFSSDTHGSPPKIMLVRAEGDDVVVKITGCGFSAPLAGGAAHEQCVKAGTSWPFSMATHGGRSGVTLEVKGASASSTVCWGPFKP